MNAAALLMAFYTFIALLFIDSTLREGAENGRRWDADRVAGLLLCLVWPATLAAIAILAYQNSRTNESRPG